MQNFTYQVSPMRVVFGAGTVKLVADEVARLGIKQALVLSIPQQLGQAQTIAELIGSASAGVFSRAVVHTPTSVTEEAMQAVQDANADGLIAIGGGATTGLGKAIAFRTGLPQIVLPTSYAGSEMTPILGETDKGIKTTKSSLAILPETVIYDVDLTLSMPPRFSALSGLNAMAHAIEALYARDKNPVISLMAEEAIANLARALPGVCACPDEKNSRFAALYSAWLSGVCLGSVGMALHHKLCHAVGALFDLPHAETHAVLLPHTIAYNAPKAKDAMIRVSRALGTTDAAEGVWQLSRRLHTPCSLAEIGMPESGITEAAELSTKNPYWNPRSITRENIRNLLARAWSGERPQAD